MLHNVEVVVKRRRRTRRIDLLATFYLGILLTELERKFFLRSFRFFR